MGRASKWFRSVLGLKKTSESSSSPSPSTLPPGSASKPLKDKRRWSFVKSYRESDTAKTSDVHHTAFRDEAVPSSGRIDGVCPDMRAMTVAAAKAAVAEAAVAAAQAAAAVVRLTSSVRCPESIGTREEWAAIKIQAAFRGCLVSTLYPLLFRFPFLFVFNALHLLTGLGLAERQRDELKV